MRRSDGMTPYIRELAEKLWNYHQLRHPLSQADVILVLCSHDRGVAERGAELFLGGWAPLLVFSGGLGTITRHLWTEPEADQFAAIAERMDAAADEQRRVAKILRAAAAEILSQAPEHDPASKVDL